LNNFLGSPDKRSARGGGGQPNSELALHLQKAPFFSVQHSPKQQPRKVLFITGVDAGMSLSKSKHDLKGGSPNTMQGKKLKFNYTPAISKSVLGHFATTTGPNTTMSPGTSSLPDIAPPNTQEALLKEM
jgi:hypothetical protein